MWVQMELIRSTVGILQIHVYIYAFLYIYSPNQHFDNNYLKKNQKKVVLCIMLQGWLILDLIGTRLPLEYM